MSFCDILCQPDYMSLQTDAGLLPLHRGEGDSWGHPDATVFVLAEEDCLSIKLSAPSVPVYRLHLRWHREIVPGQRFLGDHWERGYGDLAWSGMMPERIIPWYVLASDGNVTHGYGVKTAPAALCWWRVDAAGISLWLDVRCGGSGVCLGQRLLHVADIVTRRGQAGETPFHAAQAFCRRLCAHPRLPDHPVYGSNNWYYAYGQSSHQAILQDTELLLACAPESPNRPYMVIDGGWQVQADATGPCCGGPWDRGNADFPDMPSLAHAMRQRGVRPGIWCRPLAAAPRMEPVRLLPAVRVKDASAAVPILDPSIPENLAAIAADMRRFHDWGYALIKHDWTACDITGRWGYDMGADITNPGWTFANRARTTAEIIRELYRTIRQGADTSLVLGCNTMGHLAAWAFRAAAHRR